MSELTDALKAISEFTGYDLTERIFSLEKILEGADKTTVSETCMTEKINFGLFHAAYIVKDKARQIDTIMHAVGMLSLLPIILETDEIVKSLSIGAGKGDKEFDLETNIRLAEFEFTEWQGRDSGRQTSLFEDFYHLAEFNSTKKKCLYILGAKLPKKFLNDSSQSIASVLNKTNKIQDFQQKVGNKFQAVNQYYLSRKNLVEIIDIEDIWGQIYRKLLTSGKTKQSG
jgi:hypothetical protein